MSKKSLILYYSDGVSVSQMKDWICQAIEADVHRIEALDPYPQDYSQLVALVNQQVQEHVDVPYKPLDLDLSAYDTVFVGSPNWSGTLALPLKTFLKDHSLAGKKVLLFGSHGGAGLESMEDDLKQLCPDADVQPSFVTYRKTDEETEADLNVWLHTYAI